jgi:tetratricopeptide (TPR) repeat protein
VNDNEASPEYWINMAFSLQREGKPDKAQKYYEEALKLDPDIFEAWMNLGTIYDEMNNLDEAMACYKNAKNLNPSNAAIWYNLGLECISFLKFQRFS